MAEFILEAQERKPGKQSQLTDIRKKSRIPGVIYGFSQEPLVIDLDYKDLLGVLKKAGTSNIVSLKIASKQIKTIVRSYQQDPVSDKLIHVDFMAISDKKPLTTKVPLEFIGHSKAVREQGGQLNKKIHFVNVKCLAGNLPDKIAVDISVFNELGQKLLISDLQVNEKVTILNNPNDPVANVTVPKKIKLVETTETKSEGEEADDKKEEGEAKPEAGNKKEEGEAKPETDDKK